MSENGLWSLEFLDARGEVAAGGVLVVLQKGTLIGGDGSYYYVGTYSLASDRILRAKLSVKHFAGPGL